MIKFILIIIYGILGSGGMYLIKLGSQNGTSFLIKSGILKISLNFQFISGFCCYVLSFLIYMYLISKYNLSYIIPLASAVFYIFILFISIFLLKETFSIYSSIGFFLIFNN